MVSVSHDRLRLAGSLAQIELPGDAEAIIDPGKPSEEAIVVDWHQGAAAFPEGRVEPIDFRFRFAFDEEGLPPKLVLARKWLTGAQKCLPDARFVQCFSRRSEARLLQWRAL